MANEIDNKKLIELSKKMKLLYVEDNDQTRIETLEVLNIFFDDIVVAVDGLDGYSKFKENEDINIIITDINMPNMDGITMCKKIRELDKDARILVFSAHNEAQYIIDSIEFDIEAYLLKPIVLKQFKQALYKAITILNLKKDNAEYKKNLEQKVQEQVKEIMEKDEILSRHAKLAAMGEMIDIIAHQWKQPLNVISMRADFLNELSSDTDSMPSSEIQECSSKVIGQVQYLVNTLDQFRSFFRPVKAIESIDINELFESLDILLKDDLIKNNIKLEKELEDALSFEANKNEIIHIFINLINNARDAFIQNEIENRNISVTAKQIDSDIILTVKDNAGGIPENILPNIFEANFTTKRAMGGTGIGLYMCKIIADKYKFCIDVEVEDESTTFTVNIKNN